MLCGGHTVIVCDDCQHSPMKRTIYLPRVLFKIDLITGARRSVQAMKAANREGSSLKVRAENIAGCRGLFVRRTNTLLSVRCSSPLSLQLLLGWLRMAHLAFLR